MAKERKEPTLSSSKSVQIEGSAATPSSSRVSVKAAQPKVIIQKHSSGLLWFTLLIALAAALGVGYMYWQLTQASLISQVQQQRIDELENKLLLSGDESTQSLAAVSANLKTQAATLESMKKDIALSLSEVDKLWATRNANVKQIEKVSQELSQKITAGDKKITADTEQSLSKQVELISQLEQNNSEQELLIQSLRERLNEQSKTTQNLVSQVRQYAAANKQVAAIESKVDGYEETIRSFDKFRITTNRDLLLLKERAGILSAPAR